LIDANKESRDLEYIEERAKEEGVSSALSELLEEGD
jgi:hypothetical protein